MTAFDKALEKEEVSSDEEEADKEHGVDGKEANEEEELEEEVDEVSFERHSKVLNFKLLRPCGICFL